MAVVVPERKQDPAPQPVPRPKYTERERKEIRDAYLFLSPWLLGMLLFTAGPILFSLFLSFCRWDVISPIQWIGLGNYQQMLQDKLLRISLVNTISYAALYIPLSILVALGLAMLLNQKLKGMGIFRTLFYLPTLTQGIATFTLWSIIFEPEAGLLNRGLRTFISNPPGWLVDPAWSKPALVIMALWSVGGTMLIFLAGLKNIPVDFYEAASIDGAKPVTQFFRITLPMLSPTIFFNVIMATIGAFQVFAAAFVLTSGGPSNSTLFYVYYLFNRSFVYFNMGYASAMAWLLFAIVLALTVLQTKVGQKWVHYS
jgi:multiple sugar transport system permease protein